MPRRAIIVLLLASSLIAPAVGGCMSRDAKFEEARRLDREGRRLRQEGFETGNMKRMEKGQKMIEKGDRMRESLLSGM